MDVRINKYLAEAHSLSRREADRLVEAGKVFINGAKAEIGQKVSPADRIEIRGFVPKTHSYYAYWKPRGLITHKQKKGEKDVASSVGLPGVFPVGRLDKDSDGLMILTDNGRLADRLLNPKYDHDKEYLIRTRAEVKPYMLKVMSKGMDLEGGLHTKPAEAKLLGDHLFTLTLSEGKKHEVRRMCDAFDLHLETLTRIRILNISLDALKPGQFRKIKGAELEAFLGAIGL